jgi:hypothetical protein
MNYRRKRLAGCSPAQGMLAVAACTKDAGSAGTAVVIPRRLNALGDGAPMAPGSSSASTYGVHGDRLATALTGFSALDTTETSTGTRLWWTPPTLKPSAKRRSRN